MTVVIGAVVGNRVWLSGDSYCGDEDVVEYCSEPKVFKITSTVGFGLCGDIRTEVLVTQAATHILNNRQRVTDEWLKNEFSMKLHAKLKDSGVLQDNKGIHSLEESEYMLAHAGRLYYMDSNLALWSPREPYLAIGAGREMAIAALAYAHESGDLEEDPSSTLNRIMAVLEKHNHHVRSPYTLVKV